MVTKKIYSVFHALFLICAVIALVSCEKALITEEVTSVIVKSLTA